MQTSSQGKPGQVNRVGLIALAGLAGTMFVTNPSSEDFATYATDQFARLIQQNYCQGSQPPEGTRVPEWANSIGSFFQDVCKTVISGTDSLVDKDQKRQFVKNLTERQNFYLFSVYSVKVSFQRPFTVIGVFGQFIPFSFEPFKFEKITKETNTWLG